jgi:hypothetical protein
MRSTMAEKPGAWGVLDLLRQDGIDVVLEMLG